MKKRFLRGESYILPYHSRALSFQAATNQFKALMREKADVDEKQNLVIRIS